MAEFSEVMHNIQRRCKLCGQGERIGCTIRGAICANISNMPHDADWNALEKEVMSWAAEHPEPVYPTWHDFLFDLWPCDEGISFHEFITNTPIPADIAQKLGIEPKEGSHERV